MPFSHSKLGEKGGKVATRDCDVGSCLARGSNGEYRRRRAVVALACFLSHLSGKRTV